MNNRNRAREPTKLQTETVCECQTEVKYNSINEYMHRKIARLFCIL